MSLFPGGQSGQRLPLLHPIACSESTPSRCYEKS